MPFPNSQLPSTVRDVARLIDHSVLHPTATDDDVLRGAELSLNAGVAAFCTKPYAIDLAYKVLAQSDVAICAVIGFPHGNSPITVKCWEAAQARRGGATEIDAVINFGKVLSGDWDYVSHEIGELQHVTNRWRGILKVIFETGYIEDEHILRLCDICSQHQVTFVKTSTGFGYARQPDGNFAATGATESHVRMMREHCPASVGVKASGGIRTLDDVLRMVEAGANRIGASSTESILQEARERGFPEE